MSFRDNVNLVTRTIYLGGELTDSSARDVIQGLLLLGQKNSKQPITVIINSPGGSADDGLAIHDAIAGAPFDTYGLVYGQCMSAAFTVLQACSYRLASPNASLMLHDGTAALGRNHMLEVAAYADALKRDVALYHKIIAQRSGNTEHRIRELSRFATFMSADEALQQNFIDGILCRPPARKPARRKNSLSHRAAKIRKG